MDEPSREGRAERVRRHAARPLAVEGDRGEEGLGLGGPARLLGGVRLLLPGFTGVGVVGGGVLDVGWCFLQQRQLRSLMHLSWWLVSPLVKDCGERIPVHADLYCAVA